MFEYSAHVERVVDGDTFLVLIDLGFHVFTRQRVRLLDVYAPELSTDEGKRIVAIVKANFEGKEVTLRTHRDRNDKYGRYLAEVQCGKVNVNAAIRFHVGKPSGRGAHV